MSPSCQVCGVRRHHSNLCRCMSGLVLVIPIVRIVIIRFVTSIIIILAILIAVFAVVLGVSPVAIALLLDLVIQEPS